MACRFCQGITPADVSLTVVVQEMVPATAVVNLPQATQLIRDGQTITVDGAKGRAVINDDHPKP